MGEPLKVVPQSVAEARTGVTKETVEEIGTSQRGLFLTQEQIDDAKVPETQVPGFPLVGPIGTQWHKDHPIDENAEPDEDLLLGS